jgi:hypothetical protein
MAANEMDFNEVDGQFMNGHNRVRLSYATVPGLPVVFQAKFNEDNDGAPNCYGPGALNPLESNLAMATSPWTNFGSSNNFTWVGLLSATKADAEANHWVIDTSNPLFEARQGANGKLLPASQPGTWPIVQQAAGAKDKTGHPVGPVGPRPGFYISTTSAAAHPGLDRTNQNRYFNATTVPYGAISPGVTDATRVGLGDFGLVIRKKTGVSAGFVFADTGSGSKVGECSRFLFQTVSGRDNSDDVCFLLFPESGQGRSPTLATVGLIEQTVKAQMAELAKVSNPEALPRFLAMGADPEKWMMEEDDGRMHWVEYNNIVRALAKWGYKVPPMMDLPSKEDLDRIARTA